MRPGSYCFVAELGGFQPKKNNSLVFIPKPIEKAPLVNPLVNNQVRDINFPAGCVAMRIKLNGKSGICFKGRRVFEGFIEFQMHLIKFSIKSHGKNGLYLKV